MATLKGSNYTYDMYSFVQYRQEKSSKVYHVNFI